MAAPTDEELLEIFEELNYPSATKLRAAVLKRGFKATLKSLEKFVDSQTPGQLFKHIRCTMVNPSHRGPASA